MESRTFHFSTVAAVAFSCPALFAVTAPAGANDVADVRRDAMAQIATIAGDAAVSRTAPYVDDAVARIVVVVRAVDARDRRPRDILDRRQKFALLTAGAAAPDLRLRPDQRDALDAYARDVATAVRPIVDDDGRRIEALFAPNDVVRLAALRDRTLERIRTHTPLATGLPNAATFLASESAPIAPGAFVLLVEIDPRRVAAAVR